MDSKGSLPPYCPPACGGRWCVSTKGGGPAGCVERLCRKVRRKGAEGSLPPIVPPLAGGRWCVSTKGGGPAGPAGCVERLCFKGQGKGSKGSEGSAGKVDGAFGPEGCVEGLCSLRSGGDSGFAAEGGGLPPKAAMIIKSALRGLHLCHYGSPVISSGGNRRFESDFRGASEREPRNLPQECCLVAVSSWLIVCVSQGFAQLLSEKGACVTGLPFCYINHTKHSAELATGVATPYPAAPDSPLFRGENRLLYTFL